MIDCRGCSARCCQGIVTPVLLADEERLFGAETRVAETGFRSMRLLARGEDERCVFLDRSSSRCTIYARRPLECRIYPYLLDFSRGRVGLKLDARFCPGAAGMKPDAEGLLAAVSGRDFPPDWIKGYLALEAC